MQTQHFLKAKLTPILNPPISWAANMSAKNAITVPKNRVSHPLIDTLSPSYNRFNSNTTDRYRIAADILTLYKVVTSLMNGSKIF